MALTHELTNEVWPWAKLRFLEGLKYKEPERNSQQLVLICLWDLVLQ